MNAPPPSAFLRLSTEIQAAVMAQQSCKLCYQKELFEKNQISQFTLKIVKTKRNSCILFPLFLRLNQDLMELGLGNILLTNNIF